MNVDDVLALYQGKNILLTHELVREILTRRRDTFDGFRKIENGNGLFTDKDSVHSPKGQEMIRLLLFRGLEEAVEAYWSHSRNHVLEELIDSFNYFISIPFLPGWGESNAILESLVPRFFMRFDNTESFLGEPFLLDNLGHIAVSTGRFTDRLRNRTWMNNTQDPYLDAWEIYTKMLDDILSQMLRCFNSFPEFAAFYLAKDDVLQFRLRTNY